MSPQATVSGTGWPQMDDVATRTIDAPSTPSMAACSDLVYRVPAKYRWEWCDRLIAITSIELSGSSNVPFRSCFPPLTCRRCIDHTQVPARDTKIWLIQKRSLKRFKQVRIEDQIRVKFDGHVPAVPGLRDRPLERLQFVGARQTIAFKRTRRPSQDAHAWMALGELGCDVPRRIGRAIVNKNHLVGHPHLPFDRFEEAT